ncbi:MAG: iron-containing alcohol dehydrogenase [Chloroflexota bacterium]
MPLTTFGFIAPPVVFGIKSAENIAEHIQRLAARRVLLISDRGLEKAGLVDQLSAWIGRADVPVVRYTDIEPEPSTSSVRACVTYARQADCNLVVGLGGGSVMDSAKVVAALLGNDGDIMDYLGINQVPRKGAATILLPTTAGTGSEIGRGALFYVPERQSKEAVISSHLLTDLALIDPMLALTAPPSVTAVSGLDALCHAIESYTGRAANPLSKPFAELAIRWISRHLVAAVANGCDLQAREGMALGCLYASVALANANTHAVHALAYPLQGRNRIVHGKANGVLLPYVIEYIAPDLAEPFAQIAGWMGLETQGVSAAQIGVVVANGILTLAQEIGMPTRMSALGVHAEQLDEFTAQAVTIRRLLDNCPVPLGIEAIRTIYQNAL